MKQIIQNYRTGELQMVEVPEPAYKSGMLTVRTATSLVSVGTEKAMIDVAKKSLLGKALARPDWVKQVIDKVKTEGRRSAVYAKLRRAKDVRCQPSTQSYAVPRKSEVRGRRSEVGKG